MKPEIGLALAVM